MLNIEKSIEDGYQNLIEKPIVFLPAFLLSFLSIMTRQISLSMISASIYNIALSIIAFIIISLFSTFVGGLMVRLLFVKKASIVKESMNVLNVYLSLLVAGIIFVIAVIAGTIALIIPGIIIAIRLGFYDYPILLDKKGFEESLKMSWKITKNNGWRIFVLSLMLIIISGVLGIVPSIIGLVSETSSTIATFLINGILSPLFVSIYLTAYMQLKKH